MYFFVPRSHRRTTINGLAIPSGIKLFPLHLILVTATGKNLNSSENKVVSEKFRAKLSI